MQIGTRVAHGTDLARMMGSGVRVPASAWVCTAKCLESEWCAATAGEASRAAFADLSAAEAPSGEPDPSSYTRALKASRGADERDDERMIPCPTGTTR
jgi:hypothetical protein